ncbi:MAG: hypothetical protein ACR2LI_02595 [Propionibacteriaceae bacterium]
MLVRPISLVLGALASTMVAGAAVATPASAETLAQGRVVARGGVIARSLPTTASTDFGTYAEGERVTLLCKLRGSTVGGNSLWYRTPSEGSTWVSARYVENIGAPPAYCGSSARYTGRTTATLTRREAPTTRTAAHGTVASGAEITIICKWEGDTVAGNSLWYHLTDGRWVAARYVANVGAAPELCL